MDMTPIWIGAGGNTASSSAVIHKRVVMSADKILADM